MIAKEIPMAEDQSGFLRILSRTHDWARYPLGFPQRRALYAKVLYTKRTGRAL